MESTRQWTIEHRRTTGLHGSCGGNIQINAPDGPIALLGRHQEKHARLIAAAPAMLEALKASENWLSELAGPDDDTPDTGLRGLLVDVRHAIAQAEGKE